MKRLYADAQTSDGGNAAHRIVFNCHPAITGGCNAQSHHPSDAHRRQCKRWNTSLSCRRCRRTAVRAPVAFEGAAPAAFEIAASWPHSIKPPQCLVEVWSPVPSEEKMMALITTRGFGSTMNAQAWQQLIMERGHPKEGRNWRSVAARPY